MSQSQNFDVDTCLFTGDIMLFSGESLFSHSIRKVTNSRWSHCGMVVRDHKRHHKAQIWDVSKKHFGGEVGLYDLRTRLSAYKGAIAYRSLLRDGVMGGLGIAELTTFNKIYQSLVGRPYETKKLELLKAAFDPTIFNLELAVNDPDLTSIFCGELVAETYKQLGLLPDTLPSNEYVPADFSQSRLRDLEKGYHLADEIIVKEPT